MLKCGAQIITFCKDDNDNGKTLISQDSKPTTNIWSPEGKKFQFRDQILYVA